MIMFATQNYRCNLSDDKRTVSFDAIFENSNTIKSNTDVGNINNSRFIQTTDKIS